MNSDDSRIGRVQEMFAAFGRGDIAWILENCTDDVVWEATTPWNPSSTITRFSGRSGVGEFFSTLSTQMSFDSFEPQEYAANGDLVVALGRFAARANATGKSYGAEWAMMFRLRGDKLAEFKEYSDQSGGLAAFGTQTAAAR
ncbi:MAG: nuclear transport factor 2 family protein [Candidatus Velthaea sp.]